MILAENTSFFFAENAFAFLKRNLPENEQEPMKNFQFLKKSKKRIRFQNFICLLCKTVYSKTDIVVAVRSLPPMAKRHYS